MFGILSFSRLFFYDNGQLLVACLLQIHSDWKKIKKNLIKIGAPENSSVKAILYKIILSFINSCRKHKYHVTHCARMCFTYLFLALYVMQQCLHFHCCKYIAFINICKINTQKTARGLVNALSSAEHTFLYSSNSANRHCKKKST